MDQPLGSRYLIGELLGRGGMGSVHRGRDATGREYAIKVLRPEFATDPDVVTRFVRERLVLVAIRDEHLVAVHDLVVEGDTLAIVMDLVPGHDLRVSLRQRGVVPPAEVARIGAGVAAALTAAHSLGVLHRDVKPENVLLDTSTTPATVKLADFGIARLVGDSRLSRVTALIGTPTYLPPEVYAGGPAVAAGDLYALGVLLYELCCGVPPFTGDVIAVMTGHVGLAPGRPGGVPDSLWELIAGLLEKDPAHRPAGAAPVRDALSGLADSLLGAPAAPLLERPPAGAALASAWSGLPTQEVATPAGPAAPRPRAGALRGTSAGLLAGIALAAALAGAGLAWVLDPDPSVGATAPCDADAISEGCGSTEAVLEVQQRLLDLCYFVDNSARNVNADGRFGAATETALQRFQIRNKLLPDGVVGPQTRDVLFGADAVPDTTPCPLPASTPASDPGTPTPAASVSR